MSISESRRYEMQEAFREHFGVNIADTLMEHLPPSGWGDVARVRDVEQMRKDVKSDLDLLESRILERLSSEFVRQNRWMTGVVTSLAIALTLLVVR